MKKILINKNILRKGYSNGIKINLSEDKKKQIENLYLNEYWNTDEIAIFDKRGVSGIDGVYHLDHKYSICEGFKNNIDIEVIASMNNLEFIPWEKNLIKKTKCSISKEELINN